MIFSRKAVPDVTPKFTRSRGEYVGENELSQNGGFALCGSPDRCHPEDTSLKELRHSSRPTPYHQIGFPKVVL